MSVEMASITEPVRYVSVYRMEHLGCVDNPHHGPNIATCFDSFPKPEFGQAGPCPWGDGLGEPHYWEKCGCLDEQFDLWWGPYLFGGSDIAMDEVDNSDIPRLVPHGWGVTEYRMPQWALKVGRWQVVFDPRQALWAKPVEPQWLECHGIKILPPPKNVYGSGVWISENSDDDEEVDCVAA